MRKSGAEPAVRCSMGQCVAVFCSVCRGRTLHMYVYQCIVAVCCSVLQCAVEFKGVVFTTVHVSIHSSSLLQHVVLCCKVEKGRSLQLYMDST